MTIITVWYDENLDSVKLMQLSENPEDGTNEEQILYFSTLEAFQGYTCVSENYTGSIPLDGNYNLWTWDGIEIKVKVLVPQSVTPRQVRLMLLSQNLLSQVVSTISQMDEATRITWEYAMEFQRYDPLLVSLAQQLELTDEQVDQFFIAASKL